METTYSYPFAGAGLGATQFRVAEVEVMAVVAASVGFKQDGEIQLTLASQPGLLLVPSERHRIVIDPEASVEVMVPGLVVP